MLLKSDSISWRKILQNSHNSQMQWPVVSTLCQETKKHLNRKVGSEGTPKLGPYWKSQPVACKIKMELRSELCPWTETILTYGSEFLMALTNWSRIWTTTSRKPQKYSSKNMRWDCMRVILQADQRPKRNHNDENLPALPQELYLLVKEFWPMLNQENICSPILKCRRNYFIFFVMEVYPEKTMEQLNSGESKTIFRNISCIVVVGLTTSGKSMARGGRNKKRYQYCTDSLRTIWYLRALQGHSRRSLIDPTLQDDVVIQSNFFQYIYHVGCAFNLHSIINSGLIPGVQSLSKRQTVFFLPVDPMDKEHKDPDTIDLGAPRLAQYMHKAWKKHQNTVYWVDINLALKKGLKFYQTRSNAIILHETLPAYCIPKVARMATRKCMRHLVLL